MTENEKATAINTTTPIVEKQSQENNLINIIPEKKLTFNGKIINPLEVIDGKTLLEMDLPPIRFVIENILPQGLFILAGSPKIGKSWLSLHFCKIVATGDQIWNNQGEKGSVLYLALEDNLNRLQTRLKKYTDDGISDLYFSIRALKIKDGLKEQIADFIKHHPETNLVIIDTLQHVRNNANDKNAYVSDYRNRKISAAQGAVFCIAKNYEMI